MGQKTLEELEAEAQALEDARKRKALEKRIANLKKEDDYSLSDDTEVVMRAPKPRDMKYSDEGKNDAEKEQRLISNLTGKTIDELDDLSMEDYGAYQRKLKSFLY